MNKNISHSSVKIFSRIFKLHCQESMTSLGDQSCTRETLMKAVESRQNFAEHL